MLLALFQVWRLNRNSSPSPGGPLVARSYGASQGSTKRDRSFSLRRTLRDTPAWDCAATCHVLVDGLVESPGRPGVCFGLRTHRSKPSGDLPPDLIYRVAGSKYKVKPACGQGAHFKSARLGLERAHESDGLSDRGPFPRTPAFRCL